MLGLTVSVPLPLVLFMLVLALVWRGFIIPQTTETKRLWLVIGFTELTLAFTCFVVVPFVGYYYSVSVLELIAPLLFCVCSMGAALCAMFLLLKPETP